MKSRWVLGSMLLTASLSVGCGLFSGPGEDMADSGTTQERYNQTLKDAEAAYAEVDKMGGAWAFTEELISDAKSKAAQNKLNEAITLAKEALFQSRTAKEQLLAQKKAGPYLF